MPAVHDVHCELDEMWAVLLGRVDPPISVGVRTLMEVAEAYHARAMEVNALIQRGEAEGTVPKGGAYYKLRTGELRSFIEMSKRAIDLGSRRITVEIAQTEREEPY